jgi:hypothetical protein
MNLLVSEILIPLKIFYKEIKKEQNENLVKKML